MGLFNFIMKGVGFEGGEKQAKKSAEKEPEEEKKAEVTADKYAAFNDSLSGSFIDVPNFSSPTGKNLVIHAPKNNKDVQLLVDCLRKSEACIVNLGSLSEADTARVLDFLAGAAYALRGNLKQLQGDLFLLTPEGVNIMMGQK